MRYSANLTMLFNEVSFVDRFFKAQEAGFRYVEFAFPYSYNSLELSHKLRENELELTLFNAPPGNWDKGERGLAALKDQKAEFYNSLNIALEYALAMQCPRVHVMAGIVPTAEREYAKNLYIENIAYAAELFRPYQICVLLEPLNTSSVPGYLISSQTETATIIREIGLDNVKLQFDLFHAQIMDGNITQTLYKTKDVIGYIQVSSVPSRNEPGTEELNFPYFCRLIQNIGYDGYIGLEYKPRNGTEKSFSLIESLRLFQ